MDTSFLSPQFAQAEINDPRFQLAQNLIGNAINNQGTPGDGTGIGALAHGINGLLGGYLSNTVRQQYANQQQGANDTRSLAYQEGMGQPAQSQDYSDGTQINWQAQPGDMQAMIKTLAANPYTADEAQGLQKQIITSQLGNQAALALKRQEIQMAADPANLSAKDRADLSEVIPNPTGFGTIAKYPGFTGSGMVGQPAQQGTISGMVQTPIAGTPTPQVQSANIPAGATGATIAAGGQTAPQEQATGPLNAAGLPNNLTGKALNDWIRNNPMYGAALADRINQRAAGNSDAGRGSGLDPKVSNFVELAAGQQEPDLNKVTNNYGTKVATVKDFTDPAGTAAKTMTALGTATNHLALGISQIPLTQNSSHPFANSINNAIDTHWSGSANAPTYDQTQGFLTGEMGAIIGNGQGTDSSRKEAQSGSPTANSSPAQKYNLAANQIDIMLSKANELANRWNSSNGLKAGDAGYKTPTSFFSPTALSNLHQAQAAIANFRKTGQVQPSWQVPDLATQQAQDQDYYRTSFADAPSAAAQTQTAASSGVQAVTTQAQYNALPKGAAFTFNGKPGIKG